MRLTIVLQLVVLYIPFLDQFFEVVPLSANDLLLAVGLGSIAFIAIEIEKWFLRRRDRMAPSATVTVPGN